jgi:hypothetical protein
VVEFAVSFVLFFLGLRWGPFGIASAWSASFWILFFPAFWYAGKPIGFGITPVLAAVWRYLLASLIAGVASAALIREIPSVVVVPDIPGALTRIAATSLIFSVLYLGAVIFLHGGLDPLHHFARLLSDVLPWKRFRAPLPAAETAQLAPEDLERDTEVVSESIGRGRR